MRRRLISTEELEKFRNWNESRYTAYDRDNIFPKGMTDEEFSAAVKNLILGSDWYVAAPLSHAQINEAALSEIIERLK